MEQLFNEVTQCVEVITARLNAVRDQIKRRNAELDELLKRANALRLESELRDVVRETMEAEMEEKLGEVSSQADELGERVEALPQSFARAVQTSGAQIRQQSEDILIKLEQKTIATVEAVSDTLIVDSYEASIEALEQAEAEMVESIEAVSDEWEAQLDHLRETIESLSDAIGVKVETIGQSLESSWNERNQQIASVLEMHSVDFSERRIEIRQRFNDLSGALHRTYSDLSEMRTSLSQLTEENCGPSGDVGAALDAASEALSEV